MDDNADKDRHPSQTAVTPAASTVRSLAEVNRAFTEVLAEAIEAIKAFQRGFPNHNAAAPDGAHTVVQKLRALEAEYKALQKTYPVDRG